MIYLDSSALLKLLVEESESSVLESWLAEQSMTPVVSSELVRLEVIRAARRLGPGVVSAARALVTQVDLVPLDRRLLDEAADTGEPVLRSLDAIHLASALTIETDLTAFVAYDHRLLDASRAAGLPVTAPGAVTAG